MMHLAGIQITVRRLILHLLFILLLILTHSIIFAQNPLLKNYTTNDGLPSYEVFMSLQDRNGYIWFATNYGVSRFDGYRFESFDTKDGLTDNTVFELYEDSIGRIWFITSNFKLSYWYNNKIYAYRYNDNISRSVEVRPYIENRSFYIDNKDNLYFSIYRNGAYEVNQLGIVRPFKKKLTNSNSQIILNVSPKKYIVSFKYSDESIIKYQFHDSIYSTQFVTSIIYGTRMNFVSTDGFLYFSQDNYLYKIKDKNCQSFQIPDFIISICEDKLGNLWVGLRNNGALCYSRGDLTKPPAYHILKGKPVTNIMSDRENGLWFTTSTSGIFYTPSILFGSFTQADGLPDNNIRMMTNGSDSSMYVITNGNSYNKIVGNKCLLMDTKIPACENILFVADIDNRTWITTDRHIYRVANGIEKKVSKAYYLLENPSLKTQKSICTQYVILNKNQEYYFASKGGIGKIKNDSVYLIPYTISLMRAENICKSKCDKLYFSSFYGVGEIVNDSLIMLSEQYPALKVRSTWVLCNSSDTSLWIATKGEGIYILHNGKISQITMKDGLSSNNIKHIVLGKNEVWASTNNGISRIYLKNRDEKSYLIQKINTENGLISNDINQISIIDKKIYVATDKGLTVFDSDQIDTDIPKRNAVLINGIKINEKDTVVSSFYELPYNTATITISFGYMSFINAGKMNYMYRLKGLSNQWDYTNSTEIRLTTLPPGKYELEIFATFNDGDHCRFPALVTFNIKHPFWEEWWFLVIASIAFISFIAGGYFYRIRQLNRRNKLKYQLFEYQRKALSSQMNPHFIFNSLNSIQLYILKNDVLTSNKYLTKFSSLMRSILVNSNEPSITLDTEINTLQTYIELEALRFDNKFSFSLSVDNELEKESIRIPTLLIQPFVENAIWHGLMNKEENGKLTINIIPEDKYCIKCIIKDDGVGRKKATEINEQKRGSHKSLGAQITQDRLALFNDLYKKNLKVKYFDLADDSGQALGTVVELIIPILN